MTVIDPLTQAALEVERHVARAGGDQPARLFALVSTADLVAHEPGLRDTLGDPAANALSAVEQEGLDVADTVEALLAQIAPLAGDLLATPAAAPAVTLVQETLA